MKKIIAIALFAATIPVANWLIENIGTTCIPDGPCLVPVGWGLMAPSGVLVIGLALVLRDWLQEVAGWRCSFYAIFLGSVLSLITSPAHLAMASAAAFTFAEIADLAVYTHLRQRGKPIAVFVSQVAGALIDSSLFVYLAFGSFDLSIATALGKIYAGAAVAIFLWMRSKCLFGHVPHKDVRTTSHRLCCARCKANLK